MERGQADKSPLDQLEAQVNLVLEHTGRLFANNARNRGAINNPLRLKQVVAGANHSFHDALDELEGELTLARAVMRRDLAVYRAKRGTRSTSQPAGVSATNGAPNGTNGAVTSKDEDVIMGESEEEQKPSQPQESAAQPQASFQPAEERKQASPLQIDIPGQDHQAPGHAGDATTGTYSNFDFESLFNDPSSASGAASRESPKEPPPQPQPNNAPEPSKPETYNGSNDFDFSDLTNFGNDTDMQDTDGISSLLPGLESYANSGGASDQQGQGTNDDFNIFDAAGAGDFGSGPTEQKPAQPSDNQQQSAEAENRDTTFDDIMNFTSFDLGDFSGGAEGEGGENKFDDNFFDI